MGNGSTAAVLEPTYTGYVASTHDALVLFEACLTGVLHHVPRRPHDRERSQLVRSGSVFIYEENASGIKRWTDGVTWSPSRILGNFLVYRELDKPFPPGEKKRAVKKGSRRPSQPSRAGEPYPRPQETSAPPYSPPTPSTSTFGERSQQSELERALVGSLVDSYGFKDSGLVKKTMSVTVAGVTHHLVSYYSVDDVMRGLLSPPTMVDTLRYIRPRPELTTKQSFRAPIEDSEQQMEEGDPSHSIYGYRPAMVSHYGMPPQNAGYYTMPQGPYGTHAPPPPTIPGYGMPHPPPPNPYLQNPTGGSEVPTKTEEYGGYRGPAGYPGFDSVGQSVSHMSPPLNRQPPPHSGSHVYRTPSISGRPSEIPTTVDPITPSPSAYSRGSFSVGAGPPLEQNHGTPQSQHVDQNRHVRPLPLPWS
ncbi:hypothetical protein FQN57_001232 [Myotisia sp. PD_48]|nr:hypothetical protein FQN57_001232 [Myotisia sp. PD_48]